jgi:hypothetical protein
MEVHALDKKDERTWRWRTTEREREMERGI